MIICSHTRHAPISLHFLAEIGVSSSTITLWPCVSSAGIGSAAGGRFRHAADGLAGVEVETEFPGTRGSVGDRQHSSEWSW